MRPLDTEELDYLLDAPSRLPHERDVGAGLPGVITAIRVLRERGVSEVVATIVPWAKCWVRASVRCSFPLPCAVIQEASSWLVIRSRAVNMHAMYDSCRE